MPVEEAYCGNEFSTPYTVGPRGPRPERMKKLDSSGGSVAALEQKVSPCPEPGTARHWKGRRLDQRVDALEIASNRANGFISAEIANDRHDEVSSLEVFDENAKFSACAR